MRPVWTIGCALGGLAVVLSLAESSHAQAPAAALAPKPVNKERFVSLEGGQNFRDLGGYRASDGRSVRWGLIYRSGSMHRLTARDFETLKGLGIRSVVDFRSETERTRDPLKLPEGYTLAVYAKNYVLAMSEIGQSLSAPNATAEKTRAAFEGFYGRLPYEFADQYREMFRQLLAGHTPLVVNCTAGKDRTGVAAALVLTALNIPRETVVEDYMLSNNRFRPNPSDPRLSGMNPEIAAILSGVEARYIQAAFRAIEARPGGINAYFRDQLGVDAEDLGRLRTLYLQND